MKTIDIFDIIWAMKRQEQSYLSKDYLHSFRDQMEHQYQSEGVQDPTKSVDQECRFRMVAWCYQVIDSCGFNRDTVAVSINYLDRFLSTTEGTDAKKDRETFELAAMTCLYTAIKTHELEAIEPRIISDLSKGNYTEEQVLDMEQKIIMALRWRLNPPTPFSFTQYFLSIIPNKTMNRKERSIVMKLAKCQTESAVEEYNFLSYDASCIALASLANAMQTTRRGCFQHILQTISKISDIDINSQVFINCREELWITMDNLGHYQGSHSIPKSSTVRKNVGPTLAIHNSPRGVITSPTQSQLNYFPPLIKGRTSQKKDQLL